jgi:hypothetical protein
MYVAMTLNLSRIIPYNFPRAVTANGDFPETRVIPVALAAFLLGNRARRGMQAWV